MFQSAITAPIGIAILNSETSPRPSPRRQLLALVTNPIIAASAIGIALAAANIELPEVVLDPLELLADLAIPTVLLAFGISLSAGTTHSPSSRGDLAIVVVFKALLMPAAAYAVARWGMAASPEQLLLVTTLAALPSAQNINTYAAVYQCNESLARNATLVSTALAVPVITAIVGLMGG